MARWMGFLIGSSALGVEASTTGHTEGGMKVAHLEMVTMPPTTI